MSYLILLRRDTAKAWSKSNPILFKSELGYTVDENTIKEGDGVNRWNDLKASSPKPFMFTIIKRSSTQFNSVKVRSDFSFNWSKNNPTLSEGEPCFELDTLKNKIGDGKTKYNDLKYIN